jgi:hypothetical protein
MEMLGLVENMSGLKCPHCGELIDLFMSDGGQRTAEKAGIKFLASLPIEPDVVKKADKGELTQLDQAGISFSDEFNRLVDQIVEQTDTA